MLNIVLEGNSSDKNYWKLLLKENASTNKSTVIHAQEQMLKLMEGYVVDQVKHFCIDVNSFEDMIQECFLEMCENFYKYDPEKGKATTFFMPIINHACFKYNYKKRQSTSYYDSMIKKLSKKIKEYETKGLRFGFVSSDKTYTVVNLAEDLQLSIKQVNVLLDKMNITHSNYEQVCLNSEYPSPEEEYFKKEEQAALKEALSELSEQELYVFCSINGIDTPEKKYTQLARELGIDSKKVQKINEIAILKLKNHPALYDYSPSEDSLPDTEAINFNDGEDITKELLDYEEILDNLII